MKHQGEYLLALTKAKHLNIRELADRIGVTRVAVEKHLKMPTISRKVLSRYTETLGFGVEEFYKACESGQAVATAQSEATIDWKQKYYDLLERHTKFMETVFIKAAPTVPHLAISA